MATRGRDPSGVSPRTLRSTRLINLMDAEPVSVAFGMDLGGVMIYLADHNAGTEIWFSRQTIGTLARAVIRCFDDVARRHDDSGYHGRWKAPFPRRELEALRTAWRNHTARPLQPE